MGCSCEGEPEHSPHQPGPGPRKPARAFLREVGLNQAEQGPAREPGRPGTGHSSREKAGAEAWEGGRPLIPSSLGQHWTGRRAGAMIPDRKGTGAKPPGGTALENVHSRGLACEPPSPPSPPDAPVTLCRKPGLLRGPRVLSFERDPSACPEVSGTTPGTFPSVIPLHPHTHSARQEDCAHLADWESEAPAQGAGPFRPRLLFSDP